MCHQAKPNQHKDEWEGAAAEPQRNTTNQLLRWVATTAASPTVQGA